MPTRPSLSVAIVAALVAFSLTSADAQMTRGAITLEQARAILGANPVAIPGYPVEFYLLGGRAVLVRQELDSGKVIAFREDRGGRPGGSSRRQWVSTRGNSVQDDGPQRILNGLPSSIEEQYWARRSYREIDGVSVRYLGSSRERIPYELLDQLAPIQ